MEVKRNEQTTLATSPPRPAAGARPLEGSSKPAPPLDFARLDLSVERIEERISPSETNVFDK